MKIEYAGKHVFITGGSSGIGLALAQSLAAQGASVTILARRQNQLMQAAEEIRSACIHSEQKIQTLQGDVGEMETIIPLLEHYQEENGVPDILINSAGITYPGKFSVLPPEIFRDLVNINYLGTVYVSRAFVNGMIRRGTWMDREYLLHGRIHRHLRL